MRCKMKKGKSKLLTDTDIKNCLRFINDMSSHSERTRLMFMMMLMTALRIHSVQKLTIGQVYDDDFNPVDSFLLQPEQNKGGKKALQVYFNDTMRQELKKYAKYLLSNPYYTPKPSDYLFKSNKGSCLSKQQIIHIFRQVYDGVGLDKQCRVHSLRATCLTKLMNANYPLPLIQQISGHASINTLSIYYRSNPKNIQNALETLNM
ncbi:tyrosine-type recombinase/integrase [bacterium]|nr:tyrosine-type recombinase/integrase [bacterium]